MKALYISLSIFILFPLLGLSQDNNLKTIIPDFQVIADFDTVSPYYPSIGSDIEGNFTIIWTMYTLVDYPPFLLTDIWGQRFNKSGSARGEIFVINDQPGYGDVPSIDVDEIGYLYVTWGRATIYGQLYDFLGRPINNNFIVSENFSEKPSIAASRNNGFIISWGNWYLNRGIYAQRFDIDGNPVDDMFKVDDDLTSKMKQFSTIDFDKEGNFIFAWVDERNNNLDIYSQRYNSIGEPQGINFRVNDDTGNAIQWKPEIGVDDSGGFIITWVDTRNGDSDIYCQRYDKLGNPLGGNFKVNDDTVNAYQGSAKIGVDVDGKFIVIWQDNRNDNSDIYGQLYSNTGNTIGKNFQIVSNNIGNQYAPDVTFRDGRIYCTWVDLGIWANVSDFESELDIPSDFELNQNYPNPFNTFTIITYTLPEELNVSLRIYNISGQEVRTLLNERQSLGKKSVIWDGRNNKGENVSSGIYIYQLTAGSFRKSLKMVLTK